MQLFTTDHDSLMDVKSLKQEGHTLVIEGRIMGALPVRAVLTPDQARAALKLVDLPTFLFLLTLLFRPGVKKSSFL
jgi:hypothetical protein